uniref:Uncharacterized protein n=1 Tax=Brassica oleracea var. oleracea TaxID=109376 RepID=A0A0D3CRG8_BRAOL
ASLLSCLSSLSLYLSLFSISHASLHHLSRLSSLSLPSPSLTPLFTISSRSLSHVSHHLSRLSSLKDCFNLGLSDYSLLVWLGGTWMMMMMRTMCLSQRDYFKEQIEVLDGIMFSSLCTGQMMIDTGHFLKIVLEHWMELISQFAHRSEMPKHTGVENRSRP